MARNVEDLLPAAKRKMWEDLKKTLLEGASKAFKVDPSKIKVELKQRQKRPKHENS